MKNVVCEGRRCWAPAFLREDLSMSNPVGSGERPLGHVAGCCVHITSYCFC